MQAYLQPACDKAVFKMFTHFNKYVNGISLKGAHLLLCAMELASPHIIHLSQILIFPA